MGDVPEAFYANPISWVFWTLTTRPTQVSKAKYIGGHIECLGVGVVGGGGACIGALVLSC